MQKENEGHQEVLERMPIPTDNPQTALLREGAAIVRLENNTQMQIAVQRPRNEAKILSDALKELDLYPSLADEVMYRKPVGKDETGKMKYAEGLSIRAAESLANRWTNSAYACDIVGEDAESVTLAAVFMDYENNTRRVIQKKVSRYYKAKNGEKKQHPPDRFMDVVIPANQSKILREVINRSLPAGLKQEYEDKARKILGSEDKNKRATKLVAAFIRLGVSKSQLEEFAGKKVDTMTPEEITELISVGNAIRDGETTIEQLIQEKSTSEKLGDRMKAVAGATGQEPAKPAQEQQAVQTQPPTAEGLTGMRLSLYERIADMAAGDMLEMNKTLGILSGGKVKGKEDLIKADDATVTMMINKMSGGKK